jgi:hypothetical protein
VGIFLGFHSGIEWFGRGNKRVQLALQNMIDEILGFVFDALIELVPAVVWKLLFLLIGIMMIGIGLTVLEQSTQTGGALIVVGTLSMIGSLVSLYR